MLSNYHISVKQWADNRPSENEGLATSGKDQVPGRPLFHRRGKSLFLTTQQRSTWHNYLLLALANYVGWLPMIGPNTRVCSKPAHLPYSHPNTLRPVLIQHLFPIVMFSAWHGQAPPALSCQGEGADGLMLIKAPSPLHHCLTGWIQPKTKKEALSRDNSSPSQENFMVQ